MALAKSSLETSVRYLANDLGGRGIRVNAISAGPVKTLSASGIKGFKSILEHVEQKAPLRRNISGLDVAGVAVFLASSLSSGMTGQILYVDAGASIVV